MRRNARNFSCLLIFSGAATLGCEDPPPPPAVVVASSTASAAAAPTVPRPAPPRLDPHVMKAYRVDSCTIGLQALKHVRAQYLGSLGGAPPGPGKIPEFGDFTSAPGSAARTIEPVGKPPPSPPAASPSATAAAKAPLPTSRRLARPTYERFVRACSVGAGLTKPEAPEVDAALKEFSTYARDFANRLNQARVYYDREEYKADDFEKGKKLHAELVADFDALDTHLETMRSQSVAWYAKAKPGTPEVTRADMESDESFKRRTSGREEAAKAHALFVDAVLLRFAKDVDQEALKAKLDELDKAVTALAAVTDDPSTSVWVESMAQPMRDAVDALKKAPVQLEPNDVAFVALVDALTEALEARHRAVTRSLVGMVRPTLKPAVQQIQKPAPKQLP